jgi:hypothetical protein
VRLSVTVILSLGKLVLARMDPGVSAQCGT